MMKLNEIKERLLITEVRKISDQTTVIEQRNGARPASIMEQRMWRLLKELSDEK